MSSSIKFSLAGLGVALIVAAALFLTTQGPSADSSGGRFGLLGRRTSGSITGTITKNTSCNNRTQCATHTLKRTSSGTNPLWTAEFNTTALLDTLADYSIAHPNCIVRIDGLSLANRTTAGTFPGANEDISVSDAHLFSSSCSTAAGGSGSNGGGLTGQPR